MLSFTVDYSRCPVLLLIQLLIMTHDVVLWCRDLKAAAEAKTNGPPDHELQQQFCALPQDLNVLQAEMIKLRAEAEGIACANPRVVRDSSAPAAIRLASA